VKNNLEDIFKDLKNYSEEAPDLMGAIHAQRSKPLHLAKLHLRRNILKYAAGLVILLSFSLFLITKDGSDQTVEAPRSLAEQGENRDKSQTNQGELENQHANDVATTNTVTTEQDIIPNSIEMENGNDKTTKPTQIKPTTVKPNSTIDQSGFKETGSNQTPSVGQTADSEQTIQSQPIVHIEDEDNGDLDENTHNNSDEQVDSENVENPIAVENDAANQDKNDEEDAVDLTQPTEDTDPVHLASDTGQNKEEESIAIDTNDVIDGNQEPLPIVNNDMRPLTRWSMEVAAGQGVAANQILTTNEASTIRSNSESALMSFQASVLVNYEISKRFEVQGGFNYMTNKTQVDFTNKYTETLMNVTSQDVIIFDYPGSPGRKVTLHDTTYTEEDRADEYKSTNLVQSYQIPLSLKWNFVQYKNASFFVKFGYNLEVAKTVEGKVLGTNYEWNTLNSDAYIRRNMLISPQTGIGGTYMLTDRFGFMAEAVFQRSMKKIWSDDNPVDEIQYNNSLKAGVKIHF